MSDDSTPTSASGPPELWADGPLLIGVVHLLPLPGAPRPAPMTETLERAESDTRTWFEGGASAVLVENFGDAPFHPDRVPSITIASMARALARVTDAASGPVGVNVLRNDAAAALGLCSAFDLAFFRVNVHSGVTVTDQGLLEGRAHQTLRDRERWPGRPLIFADLDVKHGRPLVERPMEAVAEELASRAGADAILLTGETTGRAPPLELLDRLEANERPTRVLLASGVDPALIRRTHRRVDGWIVGTWAKQDGRVEAAPDLARVGELRAALDAR